MRPILKSILIISLSMAIYSCELGKYAGAKKMLRKEIALIEAFHKNYDKLGNIDQISKALEEFADSYLDMLPMQKEISIRFPELMENNDPPDELKPLLDKYNKAAEGLDKDMNDLGRYENDPRMANAMKKIIKLAQERIYFTSFVYYYEKHK